MRELLSNKWLVSVIAGILLGLSFPPVNLSFLSFPAFILLFYLSDQCESYREAAYFSYAGFVIWNLITTYWLMMASLAAGIAAIMANSLVMTLPFILIKFFSGKTKSPVLVAFLQASAWVSYEFLHHNWDLAWPWLALGNAWSNHITLIQYISFTGHLGISFWVIFTSALAYLFFRKRKLKLAYAALAVFLLFPAFSFLLLPSGSTGQMPEQVPVTVIQPNHDSYRDYGGMSGNTEVLDSLFSVTSATRTSETKLVIWPENAIDGAITINSSYAERVADSARAWNTNFIIGTGLVKKYEERKAGALYRGIYQGKLYNVFNSALYVNEYGSTSRYDKRNLVPIVERLPFANFFAAVDVFDWVDWGSIAGFGKGTEAAMLETQNFATSGLVCYDSVFPGWVRQFVRDGASFITIITNDGWWGNTSGHHQHFAYARLRAIEFDRWIVRSANNGISGIIAPDGHIITKTDYWVRTGFNFKVPVVSGHTFYSRFGNWLSFLCLAAAATFWLVFLFSNKKQIQQED